MWTQVFGYSSKCNICLSFLPHPPSFSRIPISRSPPKHSSSLSFSHLTVWYSLSQSLPLPSPDFGQADFKRGIVSMSDLRVGAVLTGRVDNTALFGAFVDIGVGRSGLIHKSNITLDKLPVSQRRRSLALGPGERVEVRVLNLDIQRGRIGLDLIRVLEWNHSIAHD